MMVICQSPNEMVVALLNMGARPRYSPHGAWVRDDVSRATPEDEDANIFLLFRLDLPSPSLPEFGRIQLQF
jgi:hypothetical protein